MPVRRGWTRNIMYFKETIIKVYSGCTKATRQKYFTTTIVSQMPLREIVGRIQIEPLSSVTSDLGPQSSDLRTIRDLELRRSASNGHFPPT